VIVAVVAGGRMALAVAASLLVSLALGGVTLWLSSQN
jgi:predicted phage tail protein